MIFDSSGRNFKLFENRIYYWSGSIHDGDEDDDDELSMWYVLQNIYF